MQSLKLLAQATGEYTREELNKDGKLGWTDKTAAEIAAAKRSTSPNPSEGGESDMTGGGQSTGGNGGNQNQGDSQNQGGTDTGGGNGGSDTGGDDYDPNGN